MFFVKTLENFVVLNYYLRFNQIQTSLSLFLRTIDFFANKAFCLFDLLPLISGIFLKNYI